MPLVGNDGIEHALDLPQAAERLPVWSARGVADRALQIAKITDFHQRQTGMLLVIGAQPAVVGTSPFHGCVVADRHLRRFDEHFAAATVVIHVVGDEDSLAAVFRAVLQQEHLAVFEHNLAFELAIASRADGQRDVVKQIRSSACSHYCAVSPSCGAASLLPKMALKTAITSRMPPISTAINPATNPSPPTI